MSTERYLAWKRIGLNISYFRKEQHLTQQALAEMSNISRNYMQRIESGGRAAVETYMDIAEALGIPLYKIFEFRD